MPDISGISGANLLAGLLFSSIGFVGFVYGKRMKTWKPMFLGIALMAYPYFVENTILLCLLGLSGTGAFFFASRLSRVNRSIREVGLRFRIELGPRD